MGSSKNVVDALSKRFLVLQEFQVSTLGFEHLKEIYKEDTEFKECNDPA
jgi:hypothetical protein